MRLILLRLSAVCFARPVFDATQTLAYKKWVIGTPAIACEPVCCQARTTNPQVLQSLPSKMQQPVRQLDQGIGMLLTLSQN